MGLTPSGLPWPEPTAAVQAGAADIRALAEAIDPRAPRSQQIVGGNYTTDAQGYFVVNVPPGNTVVGFLLDYFGTFQPIIINPYNAGGSGVGFKAWNLSAAVPVPVASSVLTVTGVVWYSAS